MNRYNPYDHAEQLGITVIHRPLRTAHGLWLPDHNAIVIKSGLRVVHDRSALAHELGHASFGHSTDGAKEEVQADRFAASNLIDLDECLDLMKWAPDTHRLAHELGVSRRIMTLFLHAHCLAG